MRTALILTILLAACHHGEPFGPGAPYNEGPRTSTLPRQLTYSPLDDRAPSVGTTDLVYSQAPIGADARARCLATLPVEGGQALRVACPPSTTDTFIQTWDEPARSPDGARLAFVWVRSARASQLGAWTHELAVAPAHDPGATTMRVVLPATLTDGRHANTATQLQWISDRTVRLVLAYDSIWKVKGGGAGRFTDSILVPVALRDFDVETGALTAVPGGDTVGAWAPAPSGGFWFTPPSSTQLYHVDAGGTRTLLATLPAPVLSLAATGDGVAVGMVDGTLRHVLASDGTVVRIASPVGGPVHRVAWHAGSNRLVIAAEGALAGFGVSANLWLVGMD